MNLRRALVLGALASIAITACGEDDAPTAGSAADPADTVSPTGATASEVTAPTTTEAATTTTTIDLATQLGDRTYLSTTVEGFQLVEGTQIELTFEGANIAAAGGCNQLGSTWSLEGDVLVVTDMAMTEMACDPAALMDQDTWLAAVLTSRPTVTRDGDTLTLTADGTVVTLLDRAVADPDRPLEGTTWNVDGLVSGESVSSVAVGARVPSVRFEGGTATVDSGCNTGTGTYTIDGTSITFGPLATTRVACTDPTAAATESTVLATLTGTATFAIEADVLELMNGADGLFLRAAPDGG